MPATLSVELYVGLWRWWQSHYGPWLLPLRVTKIAGVNLMVNGVVCLTLFVWWIIQFHVKLDDLCFYNFVAAQRFAKTMSREQLLNPDEGSGSRNDYWMKVSWER